MTTAARSTSSNLLDLLITHFCSFSNKHKSKVKILNRSLKLIMTFIKKNVFLKIRHEDSLNRMKKCVHHFLKKIPDKILVYKQLMMAIQ